ncbi:MAG: hypothetical protein AB7P02_02305 [Alphaproteobacteria bacterium]
MGDTFAISALNRKWGEIVRAIDAAEERLKFLRASLAHLDAVAALPQPEREAIGAEPLVEGAQIPVTSAGRWRTVPPRGGFPPRHA